MSDHELEDPKDRNPVPGYSRSYTRKLVRKIYLEEEAEEQERAKKSRVVSTVLTKHDDVDLGEIALEEDVVWQGDKESLLVAPSDLQKIMNLLTEIKEEQVKFKDQLRVFSAESKARHKYTLKLTEELKNDVSMLKRSVVKTKTINEEWPIESQEIFDNLEKKVGRDPIYRDALANYFKAVREEQRNLKTFFHIEILEKFSTTGRGKNKKLLDSPLLKVIANAWADKESVNSVLSRLDEELRRLRHSLIIKRYRDKKKNLANVGVQEVWLVDPQTLTKEEPEVVE